MFNNTLKTTFIQTLYDHPQHVPSLIGLAQILIKESDWDSSESLLQSALEFAPDSADAWALLGQLYHRWNRWPEAIEAYQQALDKAKVTSASWLIELGHLFRKTSQADKARWHYQKALSLEPNNTIALLELGKYARQQGDYIQSHTLLNQAVKQDPNAWEAWFQLGLLYEHDAQMTAALSAFSQARTCNPNNLQTAYKQAQLLEQSGQWEAGVMAYKQILERHPQCAEAGEALKRLLPLLYPTDSHNLFGDGLKSLFQLLQHRLFKAALPHLARILKWPLLAHHKALAFGYQGVCYQECGLIDEALASFEAGLKFNAHPLLKLAYSTFLPVIYPDLDSVSWWRQRWLDKVDELLQEPPMLDMKLMELPIEPFYLAYQGYNDREPLSKLSQLYRTMLKRLPPHSQHSPQKHARPRIGVVSRHLNRHSVMDCFEPILTALPQAGFDLFLFSIPGSHEDHVTERLKTYAHRFVVLSEDINNHAPQILDMDLDLMLYTDLGMDSLTYLLAHSRVAPIQCVLSGHPVTTGIDTIDYYISSARLEPPNAQEHYSEQLVLLPEIPLCYPRPQLPESLLSKAELGLPTEGNLYICPMTCFKFHPAFDVVLADILQRDPAGWLVFFDFQELGQYLRSRWNHSLPLGHERLIFLPWLPKARFLNILALADVVLDTFPFGAGNTAYLTLGVGSPLVTLPGSYLRGRSTYGLYQQMEMTECIAQDSQDYVDIAIRLANDSQWATEVRHLIATKSHRIFDRQEGIDQLMAFFHQVLHHKT